MRHFPRPVALMAVVVAVLAACGADPAASEIATASSAASASPPSVAVEPLGSLSASIPPSVTTVVDQALTEPTECGTGPCVVPVDIVAPIESDGVPTVVLLPGGPVPFEGRRYLEDLAIALAERGAVAYIGVYRSPARTGSTDADTMADVRCLIRFARATTADHGGDPDRLVLVGHSFGGDLAVYTALNAEEESPACLADGDSVPDAAVGLAGFFLDPSDPAPTAPPMLLVAGSDDPNSEAGEPRAEALREAGYDAEYVELPGVDHLGVVQPATAPEVIDLILDAVP